MMSKKQILWILLVLGTAFWGISFSVTKLAMGNFSPSTFLFYRFLTATLVLALVFSKRLREINLPAIKTGALLALPLMVGIYLQTLGIKYTSASQCAFLAGTCVVMVPLLKWLSYRKAVHFKVWCAAFMALGGLLIISINEDWHISSGDLYTLSGAFGFAIYLLRVEKEATLKNLIPTIVPMFATCSLVTFAMALLDAHADWFPLVTDFWMGVVFCALFSTAYMYSVSNIAQRYISAERVAVIYLFEPVFGAIAAFFILGEELSGRLLLGGGIIFLATCVSELKFKKYSKTLPNGVA